MLGVNVGQLSDRDDGRCARDEELRELAEIHAALPFAEPLHPDFRQIPRFVFRR